MTRSDVNVQNCVTPGRIGVSSRPVPSALLPRCLQSLLERPPGSGFEGFGELLREQIRYDRLTLCGAESGGTSLRVLHSLAGVRGSGEAVGRLLPLDGTLAGTALREGRWLRIDDLTTYTEARGEPPPDVGRALAAGLRAALICPLGSPQAPLGVCELWSRQVGFFTAEHEGLLQTLQPALSAALRNDLLYVEVERRSLELGALERLARATRASLDLQSVVPVCLDAALALLGLSSGGLLLLRTDRLELQLERNLPQAMEPTPLSISMPALHSPLGQAVRERRPVLCEDISTDLQLRDLFPLNSRRVWLLAIPLLSNAPKGVVFACGFDTFPQPRSEMDRLATIGQWIGSAIDDAQHHEQHRKQLQLESLSSLAGGLAHDFNNTLSAVLLTALLLRDAAHSQSPADRARLEPRQLLQELEIIIDAARRGASLAGQLLAFSKGAPLNLLPMDINDVVLESLRHLRGREPGTRLMLNTALDSALPPTRGDREQLLRAVSNLLQNAAEAMPGGGRLHLQTQLVERRAHDCKGPGTGAGESLPAGRYVRLSVRDEGPGIDPAVRARLFEPFVTTKKAAPGLGLAVAFGVIKAHSGCLFLDSTHGRGTTFVIDLPAVEPAAALSALEEPAQQVDRPEPAARTRAPRVLVVDDEPVLVRIASRILRGAGYTADVVGSGAEALLRYALPGAYELVVLDSTMPGMSGREVLEQLLRRDPAARVLVMSGYSIDGGPAELLARGARGFLPKPFTPQELLAAISQILTPDA